MSCTPEAERVSAAELNIRLASIERALNLQAEQLNHRQCMCSFTNEEISAVKDFLKLLHETRSNVLKGVISAVVGGILLLMVLGFKTWSNK